MKKRWAYGMSIAIFLAVFVSFLMYEGSDETAETEKTSMRIGILLYQGEDTFISTLKSAIEEQAKEYEKEHDIRVTLDIMDAKGNQNTQNNQAERLIALDCDVLCVNMVDRSVASSVIDKAMDADIPVVFFNREPVEEDLNRWEKIYYVGVDAKETAILQGKILVDAYQENPRTLDRNGDGQVSYVILEGENNHQDSLIRTEWSIQTLKDGGVPLERLTGGIANWERSQALALMEQWLKEYPDESSLSSATMMTWLSVRLMPWRETRLFRNEYVLWELMEHRLVGLLLKAENCLERSYATANGMRKKSLRWLQDFRWERTCQDMKSISGVHSLHL